MILIRELKHLLRMLAERNQRTFWLLAAGFGCLALASHSFGIKLFVWTSWSIRLDRIIKVRRLNTHFRRGEDWLVNGQRAQQWNATRNVEVLAINSGAGDVAGNAEVNKRDKLRRHGNGLYQDSR
jgi:hypothetical protein